MLGASVKCFISGIVMFFAVKIVANYLSVSIINTVIEVAIGGAVYIGMLFLLKYQFLKDIFKQIVKGGNK